MQSLPEVLVSGDLTEHSHELEGERIDVLGVAVSAINMDDAVAAIEHWIEQRTPNYVCITGVHGVMESRKDCRLCDIHNQAGLVTPDGMPLVWMSRWLGAPRVERVYGPDLMRAISARSPARGYRHFYFGGAPGVANRWQRPWSPPTPDSTWLARYVRPSAL